jgi:hypothetical protein
MKTIYIVDTSDFGVYYNLWERDHQGVHNFASHQDINSVTVKFLNTNSAHKYRTLIMEVLTRIYANFDVAGVILLK